LKTIIHRIPVMLTLSLILLFSLTSCSKEENSDTMIETITTKVVSPTEQPSTALPIVAPVVHSKITSTPIPTKIPTVVPTAVPTETPTKSPIAPPKADTAAQDDVSENHMIAIDAGHQTKGNNEKEPIGPGSTTTKPKVSSGTKGTTTGVPEYKLNLVIALKVKKELIHRGYEVYMLREKNDVNLSNRERAEMANESGADLFIRIHADGSENSSVNGTSTLYPSKNNPYVSELSHGSYTLSKAIVDAMCERTGAKNRGAIARDDMSGINWCNIPVSIIEMGYMSNKKEDKLMQTAEYQDKIVQGICDGIDDYYN